MSQLDFATIGDKLTRALIGGDFAAYRALIALPLRVTPRGGPPYVLATEFELQEDFDLYHDNLTANGVTDIFRQVTSIGLTGPGVAQVTCFTHIMVHAQRLVAPFETMFHLSSHKDSWRIWAIESSYGHISWTLGQAQISSGGEFQS